jgi:hypothetical protein
LERGNLTDDLVAEEFIKEVVVDEMPEIRYFERRDEFPRWVDVQYELALLNPNSLAPWRRQHTRPKAVSPGVILQCDHDLLLSKPV